MSDALRHDLRGDHIKHRLTEPTIKQATAKLFHYERQEQLPTHPAELMAAYNSARLLKAINSPAPQVDDCATSRSDTTSGAIGDTAASRSFKDRRRVATCPLHDVRMTRDGHLVMVHDATVDRTTNGRGKVADLTLAQLQALRLRDDMGGPSSVLTEHRIPTVEAMLAASAGRIVLNLDIKDAVHVETIAAVHRAGAEDRVLVKAAAGIASPPLATLSPFDRVRFMPMLSGSDDLPQVIARQANGSRKPIGYEVPRMPLAALAPVVVAARVAGGRLWANSLWDGFIAGIGGDAEAMRHPDAVWGRLIRSGVSIIQTDQPVPLRRFVTAPWPIFGARSVGLVPDRAFGFGSAEERRAQRQGRGADGGSIAIEGGGDDPRDRTVKSAPFGIGDRDAFDDALRQ